MVVLRILTFSLLVLTLHSCAVSSKAVLSDDVNFNYLTLEKPQISVEIPENTISNSVPKITEFQIKTADLVCLEENMKNQKINTLLSSAYSYLGTPYRYGGTTRSGIDCSAFVMHSFASLDIQLPRTSRFQAQEGEQIELSDVQKGDLLFFAPSGYSRSISHVGIVEEITEDGIKFIHAASSKGVSIASLKDSYWSKRYRKAIRIIL
ncbi:MAG: C40 family peptidase [Flavobacteriales bacterium]|nr:C40 family peptidase [Flavobacteriales bacterium]